jgi:hypothetical protein
MEQENAKFSDKHRATHVSLLNAEKFREDAWAGNFFCGEKNEAYGVKFSCEMCVLRKGIIW